MTVVACAGLVVHDLVLTVDVLPSGDGKTFATSVTEAAGGPAAIGAVAAARLGSRVRLFGVVGDDHRGAAVLADLSAEGIEVDAIVRSVDGATPVSAILVAGDGSRRIVNHVQPGLHGAAAIDPAFVDGADLLLVDARWPRASAVLLEAAANRGIPGLLDLDAAPDPGAVAPLIGLASHVIASAPALRQHTGVNDLETALLALPGTTEVAVTDGAEPVRYRDGTSIATIPPVPVEATNTLGAGDVFHGAAAHALAGGASFADALALGTAAAAYACSHGGGRSGAPTSDDLSNWNRRP